MPIIRPISDLRNSFNAISELCHTLDEPIYITKNGKEDLVIMSTEFYDKISKTETKVAEPQAVYNSSVTLSNATTQDLRKELAIRKLCQMLEESEDDFKNHPEKCLSHDEVFGELRRIIDAN